jgi:peptide deformylase
MAVLPVIQLGHPGLRKRAEEITEITEDIGALAANMIDTMREHDGVGLAAPQVNISKRIFVIDFQALDEELEAEAFINPRIIFSEGEETMEEGCLSIPEVRAEVTRPFKLKVVYQTLDGEEMEEEMEGLPARVFQHELDHLDGVLFIDKISFLQKKLIEPQLKKIREENSLL